MGLDFGALIRGTAGGISSYEQGKHDRLKEQAALERQARLDLIKQSLDAENLKEIQARTKRESAAAAKDLLPAQPKPPTTANIGGKTYVYSEQTGQWTEPVGAGGAVLPQQPKAPNDIGDEEWTGFLASLDPETAAKLKPVPKAARQTVLGQYTGSQFKPPQGAVNPDDIIRMGGTLRGQFNQDNAFQSGQQIAMSYQNIKAAGDSPSPAGDIKLLTAYMKMVDPRSTVREGEFANAQNAGSVPERIVAMYNKLVTNHGRLSDQQRRDFVQSAASMATEARKSLKSVIDRYTGIAQRNHMNAEDIVTDPFMFMDGPPISDKAKGAAAAAIARNQKQ